MGAYGTTAHRPRELADIRRDELVSSLRAEVAAGERAPMAEEELVRLGTQMATDSHMRLYQRLGSRLAELRTCADPVALCRRLLTE